MALVDMLLCCCSKLRAKLGLKPLQVDDGADKENGTTLNVYTLPCCITVCIECSVLLFSRLELT